MMSPLPNIVHIIDSLGRGGAEKVLVESVGSMTTYNHVIISLRSINDVGSDFGEITIIYLDFNNYFDLPKTIIKIKTLIKRYNPRAVHSHLFWSTIIARLSIPKKISLITTYHSLLYHKKNTEQYSKFYLWLDRITYRERFITICVSQVVKDMLEESVGINKNVFVIYNFVDDKFFNLERENKLSSDKLNFVSVGNFRTQKNHTYLIETFSNYKNSNFNLCIYGEGEQKARLQHLIIKKNISNVTLARSTKYIADELQKHDIFLLASKFEGFGIALLEAMASGLPCIVSDIPAFKEVGKENCLYFDVNQNDSLLKLLRTINISGLNNLSKLAQARARFFTKNRYISSITNLYDKCL